MNRVLRLSLGVACVSWVGACGVANPLTCFGTVTSVSQTGRQIIAKGSFSGPTQGQLLMTLAFPTGTTTFVPATNDDNSATFNIGDLAPGTYTVAWSMSCDSGDDVDVKGPAVVVVM